MILTKTPLRISLFGGGTDYPAWARQHGGEVLGFAINRHVWISLRKLPAFFGYKHRVVWSKIELVKEFHEVEHPAVREIMQLEGIRCGVEIHCDSDLPARSGLGSSSSFTVGLLNAVYAMKGHMVCKKQLAAAAINCEQEVLKENVGSQDQIWAAYGGFNRIVFHPDDSFEVSPVILPAERKRELKASLMLFFTGLSRSASEVAGKQIANFQRKERHLKTMQAMVPEALAILQSPTTPLSQIGELLHEGWRLKRDLAEGVSTPEIDAIYDAGRSAGAVGGKLLGAGGGGFVLLFVPPEKKMAVRERLKDLVCVDFDIANEGSKVVVYEPEGF